MMPQRQFFLVSIAVLGASGLRTADHSECFQCPAGSSGSSEAARPALPARRWQSVAKVHSRHLVGRVSSHEKVVAEVCRRVKSVAKARRRRQLLAREFAIPYHSVVESLLLPLDARVCRHDRASRAAVIESHKIGWGEEA